MVTVHDPLPERAPAHVLDVLDRTILRVEVGSTVYGTGRPGMEDHDQMGVFIMSPEDVLGTRPTSDKTWRTAKEGERSTPTDIDLSLYSAQKFVALAAQGNPSILVALFTPKDKIFQVTDAGRMLRGDTGLFHTKQAGWRFLGYMRAQFTRMEQSRLGERAPRSNRPELVAEHGYDTKFAMHAVRLGFQGKEFIETGRMALPIPSPQGDILRAIRAGNVPYDEVRQMGKSLDADLWAQIEAADIPERPDREDVDALLFDMHKAEWAGEW